MKSAVCNHEEDARVLHKHMEYRTAENVARRARKLVVSFVATVMNHESLFYWWFHVDGSMGLDIKLSGEFSTNALSEPEMASGIPSAGRLVAPGVNAQLRQHMFCAKLEPCVGGVRNIVSETKVARAKYDE